MTHAEISRETGSRFSRIAGQVLSLAVLLILVTGVSGCSKLRARDLLNKGVAAFKNAQFDTAVEDFKQAKELDPDLLNARLYLATAYASQYIPGAPSEENMRHGNEAITEYREVLEKDGNNLSAIDGLASILLGQQRDLEVADRVGAMAKDVNALINSVNQSVPQLELLSQKTTADAQKVVDRAFHLGLVLIAVLLSGAVAAGLAYRFVAEKLKRPGHPPAASTP